METAAAVLEEIHEDRVGQAGEEELRGGGMDPGGRGLGPGLGQSEGKILLSLQEPLGQLRTLCSRGTV